MGSFLESARENVGFLMECLGVFALVVLLAVGLERLLVRERRSVSGARRSALVAMFSAVGAVLMLFDFPLFFAPGFYKLDASELPVLLCSFYLGPVAGVTAEFLKVFLKLLMKGSSTAFVGDFANFITGCALVLPASVIYHARKSRRSAIVGMVVGTLAMSVFGSVFNAVYLIPQFARLFSMPVDAIVGMGTKVNSHITSLSTLVLYAVVPFNLLKGALVSYLTFLLYKRLEKLLFQEKKSV